MWMLTTHSRIIKKVPSTHGKFFSQIFLAKATNDPINLLMRSNCLRLRKKFQYSNVLYKGLLLTMQPMWICLWVVPPHSHAHHSIRLSCVVVLGISALPPAVQTQFLPVFVTFFGLKVLMPDFQCVSNWCVGNLGNAAYLCAMFVNKSQNKSGTTSVRVL